MCNKNHSFVLLSKKKCPHLGHLKPELVCSDRGEGFSGPGEVVVGQVVVEAGTSEHQL